MSHLHVEVDGRTLWTGKVEGWQPPPDLPDNPERLDFKELPDQLRHTMRQAMAKAAYAALDKALDATFGPG